MAKIEIIASVSAETKGAVTEVDKLKKSVDSAGESIKNTGKETQASTGHFGKLKEGLSSMPGPLGQAGEGVNKLSGAFKALLLNPVGLVLAAIVAALALLYKAFTNSFEGGQKMEQIFAGIGAAGQALIDNIGRLGGAIKKAMMFDFSGAIADIKGVAKEAGAAYTAMANLTKEAQGLHKEELANELDGAERAKRLAILREQAAEGNSKERKAALLELKKDAEQNSKDDIDLAKRVTQNKIAQLTIQKDGAKKNQDEITKLKIEQINVETDNANELRRIGKQITAADKAEATERKAEAEKNAAAKKELDQKALEEHKIFIALMNEIDLEQEKKGKSKLELELIELRLQYEKRLALAKNNAELIEKVENDYRWRKKDIDRLIFLEQQAATKARDEKEKIDQENRDKNAELTRLGKLINVGLLINQNAALTESIRTENERVMSEARIQIAEAEAAHKKAQLTEVSTLTESLSSIVGKQTAVGKGLAIATALINTYQGATEALKQKSTLPSPFDYVAKAINVAAILATGFKAVKSITSVNIPGQGGGGGQTGAAITAPLAPTQLSTGINQSSINGIGNAAQGGVNRSYILDADYRNSNERNSRLLRAARI